MNILEVQNLCKTYGKGEAQVRALDHVSFSVGKGEFIAIVGESGSGKSTLLNVVGALDNPTSGKVLTCGKDIFSMPEKKLTVFRRQNIGFIFDIVNIPLHFFFTKPFKLPAPVSHNTVFSSPLVAGRHWPNISFGCSSR